jgi:hypothetical protein
MKFIIQFLAITFSGHLVAMFLPWYGVAMAAFVMGYFLKSRANFIAGFCAVAVLWVFNAWLLEDASTSDLADRVTRIFLLDDKALLYVLMGVVGGVVGGFAALTGAVLRKP